MDFETKFTLLVNKLTEYYTVNPDKLKIMKNIIEQEHKISLRVLDWFVTNYSKRNKIYVDSKFDRDIYQEYKLNLKSFNKVFFDPFSRKYKINFAGINTSCGQLCFFRWCFECNILDCIIERFDVIEREMKEETETTNSSLSCINLRKSGGKYTITF